MKNILSLIIFTLLCLLPPLTFGTIIDDFTNSADDPNNNLGFKRGTVDDGGSAKDQDAAKKGILLMDEQDVWVETLAEKDKCIDLTSKAIIIQYTSKWHSILTIQLIQKGMSCEGNFTTTTSTQVEIDPTKNVVSVPMHVFPGAVLKNAYSIAIQSFNPLVVESIGLTYDSYKKPDFFTNLDQFKKLVPVDDAVYTQIIQVSKTNSMVEVKHRIMDMDPVHLFKPWNDHITGEVKQAGYRDFFTLASREIFTPSPTNIYFEYAKTGSKNIQMIPHSPSIFQSGLSNHYRFTGRFVGMAIYHEQHLDISLSIAMYKILLQKPITLADVYSIDPSMYKYLQFILDNDIDTLRLTMSAAIKYKNDRVHIHDFIVPDGRHVLVTNKNKHEYVKYLIDWRYMISIKKQAESFKHGVLEIIPQSVLEIFDEHELKLIVEGRTDLDVEDWRAHTKYNSGYTGEAKDEILQWFWEYVESLTCTQRGKLLEFVTGSPRLPPTGFKDLMGHKFAIHKCHVPTIEDVDELDPQALMNLNILILPRYSTFDIMAQKLNRAIGV